MTIVLQGVVFTVSNGILPGEGEGRSGEWGGPPSLPSPLGWGGPPSLPSTLGEERGATLLNNFTTEPGKASEGGGDSITSTLVN